MGTAPKKRLPRRHAVAELAAQVAAVVAAGFLFDDGNGFVAEAVIGWRRRVQRIESASSRTIPSPPP